MTWYEARVTVRVESAGDQSEVGKAARALGGQLIDVEPPQPLQLGAGWDVTAVVMLLSGDTAGGLTQLVASRAKSAFHGLASGPPTVTVRQVKQRRGWN